MEPLGLLRFGATLDHEKPQPKLPTGSRVRQELQGESTRLERKDLVPSFLFCSHFL